LHLETFGNNVYVLWNKAHDDTNIISFKKSNNSGTSFGKTMNLFKIVDNSSDNYLDSEPKMSLNGGNIYVTRRQNYMSPHNHTLLLLKINNSGTSFEDPIKVYSTTRQSSDYQIDSSGNNVYIIIDDDTPTKTFFNNRNSEVLFIKSNDNGAHFSSPKYINNKNNGNVMDFAISSDIDHLYLSWISEVSSPNDEKTSSI
jgi:hypothetical protein